ncbi:hypothetical protein BGZ58_004536 [Dissophora ornata]|nr:hypothetical protein BGZ58_004536 [Dissophora ornata]
MTSELWQEVKHGETLVEIRVLPGTTATNNQPFILLSDVQDIFPEAVRFQNERRAVGFMVDTEGNRLMPLRVAFHPGIAMEVIFASTVGPSSSLLSIQSFSSQVQIPESEPGSITATIDYHLGIADDKLAPPEYPAHDNTPAPDYSISGNPPVIQETALTALAITSSSADSAPNPSLIPGEASSSVSLFRRRNHCPQSVTPELRERAFDTEDITSHQLEDLQTRVHEILSKTYEIHESSTPRLFIVLPKDATDWDADDVYENKIRVFFLCECGPSTQPTSTSQSKAVKMEHRIHLAQHKGYDLKSPHQFLKKYGAQVLGLLQMYRYGIAVAGYEPPSLENLGTDPAIAQSPAMAEGIEVAVYRAIEIIQKILEHNMSTQPGSGSADTSLRTQDYEEIAKYLKDEDYSALTSSTTAGELYRILTAESHARWVCKSHYAPVARKPASLELRNFIHGAQGIFNDKKGALELHFNYKFMASIFYGYLTQANCVVELSINLRWSTNQKDFRELYGALQQNTSIVSLKFFTSKTGPGINFLGKNKRLDVILQHIMTMPKLRDFTIGVLDGFLSRAATVPWISYLRSLNLGEPRDWTHQEGQLAIVLRNCPKLNSLTLEYGCCRLQETFLKFQEIFDTLEGLQQMQFRKLTLRSAESAEIEYKEGRIVSMDLHVTDHNIPEFAQSYGLVRKLTIGTHAHTILPVHRELVENILLSTQPYLQELRLTCFGCDFRAMYEVIRDLDIARREKKTFMPLQTLVMENLGYSLVISDIHDPASMSITFMAFNYQIQRLEETAAIFSEFGWALECLSLHGNAYRTYNYNSNTSEVWAIYKKCLDSCGGVSRLRKIEIKSLDVSSGTLEDLTHIVMDSSPYLTEFSFVFKDSYFMDTITHYIWAEWIKKVSSKLTSFVIENDAYRELRLLERTCILPFPKLENFAMTLPSPRSLENMTLFHLHKHLEMLTANPASTPTLPSYSSEMQLNCGRNHAFANYSVVTADTPGSTQPSSSSHPSVPEESSPLSPSTFRLWTEPKMSPNLTKIALENMNLGRIWWIRLFEVIDFPALVELSLRGTCILDEHVRIIQGRLVPPSELEPGKSNENQVAYVVNPVDGPGAGSGSASSRYNAPRSQVSRLRQWNLRLCRNIGADMRSQLGIWAEQHLDGCNVEI